MRILFVLVILVLLSKTMLFSEDDRTDNSKLSGIVNIYFMFNKEKNKNIEDELNNLRFIDIKCHKLFLIETEDSCGLHFVYEQYSSEAILEVVENLKFNFLFKYSIIVSVDEITKVKRKSEVQILYSHMKENLAHKLMIGSFANDDMSDNEIKNKIIGFVNNSKYR